MDCLNNKLPQFFLNTMAGARSTYKAHENMATVLQLPVTNKLYSTQPSYLEIPLYEYDICPIDGYSTANFFILPTVNNENKQTSTNVSTSNQDSHLQLGKKNLEKLNDNINNKNAVVNTETTFALATNNLNLAAELLWIKSPDFKKCLLQNESHQYISCRISGMVKKTILDNNNDALFDISATLGSTFRSNNTLVINNENLWNLFVSLSRFPLSDYKIEFAKYLIENMAQIINLVAKEYNYQLSQTIANTIDNNYPKWYINFADIHPEQAIKITHGGGYAFINNFLSGKNIGYRLEKGGLGLQVSPHYPAGTEEFIKNREITTYAPRATCRLDRPARFEAEIAAKYLLAANNDYEAAIDSSVIQYLKNIKIILI